MTKRRLVLAAVGCAMVLLGAVGSAQARTVSFSNGMNVRFDFGNTDCSVIQTSGYGVGLATYLPTVRAINATRGRDLQYVTVRSDLYKLNVATDRLELVAQGDEYRGLAADNNYVVDFQNLRTGAHQTLHERPQWMLYTNGFYRVMQTITWHRNGRVPGWSKSAWLFHAPGYLGNRYCFVQ